MKIHELKMSRKTFEDILNFRKNLDIRKVSENCNMGDIMRYKEWDGNRYTGRVVEREIKNIYKSMFDVENSEYVLVELMNCNNDMG